MVNSKLAITSLVLGLLSVFLSLISKNTVLLVRFVCLLLATAAVIMGILALNKIKTSQLEGKRMAIWGIALGILAILLILFIRLLLIHLFANLNQSSGIFL